MRIIGRASHLLPIMVTHFLFIKPDKLSTRGISQFYHERNYSNCMKVGYNLNLFFFCINVSVRMRKRGIRYSVSACLCGLLQLLKDQSSAKKCF